MSLANKKKIKSSPDALDAASDATEGCSVDIVVCCSKQVLNSNDYIIHTHIIFNLYEQMVMYSTLYTLKHRPMVMKLDQYSMNRMMQ